MKRCTFCDLSFGTVEELVRHVNDDHRKKVSKKIASWLFLSLVYFECHVQQVTDKAYKCSICDAAYAEQKYLNRHRREKHNNSGLLEEPINCQDCGNTYTRKSGLLRHQRTAGHGGYEKKVKSAIYHQCPLCAKKFTRKDVLRQHMWRKHLPHHQDADFSSDDSDSGGNEPVASTPLVPYSDSSDSDSDMSDPNIPSSSNAREKRKEQGCCKRKRSHNDGDDDDDDDDCYSEHAKRDKHANDDNIDAPDQQNRWRPHPDIEWEKIREDDPTVGGLIRLVDQRQARNRNLRATEVIRDFRFTRRARQLAADGNMQEVLYGVLQNLIGTVVNQGGKDRFMQIVLDAPQELDIPIYGVLRPVDPEFQLNDFMERLEAVLSSRSDLSLQHNFRLTMRTVLLPPHLQAAGALLKRKHCKTFLDYLYAKRSTWSPGGMGGVDCVLKCVVAGLRMKVHGLEGVRKEKWWEAKDTDQNLQKWTMKLAEKTGLSVDKMVTPSDYDNIQRYLNENGGMQLMVFSEIKNGKPTTTYAGETGTTVTPEHDQIMLAIADQHCFLITDYPTFMGKRKMCPKCFHLFDKDKDHSCMRVCWVCQQLDCDAKKRNFPRTMTPIKCNKCDVHFQTDKCYRNHIAYSTCDWLQYHDVCGRIVERGSLLDGTHEKTCLWRTCAECNQSYKEDPHGVGEHRCSITKTKLCDLGLPKKYRTVVFDFEASPDRETQSHKSYCVTAIRSCEKCDNPKMIKLLKCTNCGERRHVFFGRNCRDDFFNWLFYNTENEGAIALSHNGSAYDNYMSLRYLLENDINDAEVMCNQSRLIQLIAGRRVRLKDTFLMFGGSLRSLPKTFGFEDTSSKGHFPHKVDAFSYLDYEGVPLDIKFYCTENMSESEKAEFMEWYAKQTYFSFRKHSIEYCMNDTEVLAIAVQMFQQQCLEDTGISPFHQAVTLAQFCSLVYRSQMLDVDIGKVPANGGYSTPRNNSRLALKYLSWVAKERKIDIKTSMHGKEARVGGLPVDGFYENTQTGVKEIWQILGCFYHGCNDVKCKVGLRQRPDMFHPLLQPMRCYEVYNRTLNQIENLKSMGYTVHAIWEHELIALQTTNREYKSYCGSQNDEDYYVEIDARSALYGGRTEAMNLCTELTEEDVNEGWRIFFHDVVSLYPFVQFCTELPCGHPTVLTAFDIPNGGLDMSNEAFAKYYGLARVTVEAPNSLRYPVLPIKIDNKLCFTLCHQCAKDKNKGDCVHLPKERLLTGTWVSTEIELALKHGYKLVKVHRIWHYEKSTENAFKKYVLHFLKGKVESSGIPEGYTIETLPEFKRKFEEIFDIEIDISKMHEKNPGKRLLCKIMLNSLWGKFSQSLDRQCNLWTGDYDTLVDTLANPNLDIGHIEFSSKTSAFVTYRQKSYEKGHALHSPVIASFVTSAARQHMFKYMDMLGDKLLYMDTDSFIWRGKVQDESPLPQGPFLGQFTNELAAGDFGVRFYTPGLKSYTLVCNSGKVIAKCKGIKNNLVNKKLLTPRLMKGLVFGNVKEIIENYSVLEDKELREQLSLQTTLKEDKGPMAFFPYSQIQRIKAQGLLRNRSGLKGLRTTFDKRRILPNLNTLPYGYSEN